MTEPRRRSARFVLLIVALMALPLLIAVAVGMIRGPNEDVAGRASTTSESATLDTTAAVAFGVTGVAVAGCVAAPFVARSLRRRRAEPTGVQQAR